MALNYQFNLSKQLQGFAHYLILFGTIFLSILHTQLYILVYNVVTSL